MAIFIPDYIAGTGAKNLRQSVVSNTLRPRLGHPHPRKRVLPIILSYQISEWVDYISEKLQLAPDE